MNRVGVGRRGALPRAGLGGLFPYGSGRASYFVSSTSRSVPPGTSLIEARRLDACTTRTNSTVIDGDRRQPKSNGVCAAVLTVCVALMATLRMERCRYF